MAQQTLYDDDWDDLRARYRRCWLVALTFVPAGILAALLSHFVAGLFPAVALGYILAWFATCFRVFSFHCPRCRQQFFFDGSSNSQLNIFVLWRCLHCRLPKWSEPLPE